MYSDDFDLMNSDINYDKSANKFAIFELADIHLFTDNLPFESIIKL